MSVSEASSDGRIIVFGERQSDAQHRFKERIREITSRNRGHKVQTVIDELNLYIRGWLNYYKLSSTYKEVLALSVWVRRRVRLYY